jgi:hypothetical protein
MAVADQMVFALEELLDDGRTAEFLVASVEKQALVEAGHLVDMFGDHPDIMGDEDDG